MTAVALSKLSRREMLEMIPGMIAASAILSRDEELRASIEETIPDMSDEDLQDLILQLQGEEDFIVDDLGPELEAYQSLEEELDNLVRTEETNLNHDKRAFLEEIEGFGEEEEAEDLLEDY